MTQSTQAFERTFTTGASDLDAKKYYIVKQHTDGTLILSAAATDKHVGVLINKPKIGEAARVQFLGTVKVVAGGTIGVGAWVTANSSGQAIATTTAGDVVIGKFLGTASAASGDVIEVQLHMFVL